MKMQLQPCPKTRITCVCPRFPPNDARYKTQSNTNFGGPGHFSIEKYSLKVHFSSTEHRYIELFLNSTSSGSASELGEFLPVLWLNLKACVSSDTQVLFLFCFKFCCITDQMKDFFSLQVVVGVTTTVIQEGAVVPEIVGLEVLTD